MTTIGEIRLYKVGNVGKMLLFQSKMPDGERGSFMMHMPATTLPKGTEYIDVRVQVESTPGWHPVQDPQVKGGDHGNNA